MALRVLLADESSTIKKVFQLALQDFAVQVTSVNVGIDVEQVAQKIKPDIIFADVLLQKKNGYDVCRSIKANTELTKTPVVLIWSGFMELDQAKYKSSGANAHLEKPFDAQRLRQVVQSLVEKTKTQPLSQFLTFPKLPDFEELEQESEAPPARAVSAPTPAPTPSAETNSWSMDSFESIDHPEMPLIPDEQPELGDIQDDFVAVELPTEPPRPPKLNRPISLSEDSSENEAQWVQKTLSNFRLDPNKRKEESTAVPYKIPEEKIDPDSIITNVWTAPEPKSTKSKIMPPSQPLPLETEDDVFELDLADDTEDPKPAATMPTLSEKEIEAVIRAQSSELIEKVVWQVVPEIATRIIERELERLLKERDAR